MDALHVTIARMQRSYPSGAQKRAAALEKEKEAQVAEKIPKLTTFFTPAGGTREETDGATPRFERRSSGNRICS